LNKYYCCCKIIKEKIKKGGAGYRSAYAGDEEHKKILVGIINGRGHPEEPDVDGIKTLKCILEK
jgi:hypothetical protein